MTEKEYIMEIARGGNITVNEILCYAKKCYSIENLLWELWMADKAVYEPTGKPLVTDEAGINRVSNAFWTISREFGINIFVEDQQHEDPQEETDHYSSSFSAEEMDQIYRNLLGKYIDCTTTPGQWLYMCTGQRSTAAEPEKPVTWTGTQATLAIFISNWFGDCNSRDLWDISSRAFLINSKAPNIQTMKNYISSLKNDRKDKSKKIQEFEQLISL